jgi:hypothetical protein
MTMQSMLGRLNTLGCNCQHGFEWFRGSAVRDASDLLRQLWLFSRCESAMRVTVRTCAGVLGVLALFATAAAGQPTTEDGIRAVLRGEYKVGARVLRPLADDEARPDPVAQFFLAVLYGTGQGVPPDMGRACSLFLRSGTREHPFSEQSAAIAASMADQMGGGALLECVAEERWRGGPPQSFVLGPSQRIVFGDRSVRVTNGEREQRTSIVLPPDGAFLPIQYSPLDVTGPQGTRRHFLQWFYWKPEPASKPSSWTLNWILSEVVADQWIVITSETNLLTTQGSTPPASEAVPNVVRLRVNANGDAEFSISSGASPRTEIIRWQGSR